MFISKDITVGQAAVIASIMRHVPSEYYVEDGKLNFLKEGSGGRNFMDMLGERLGIGAKEKMPEAPEPTIYTTELPDTPTALWRVMRMADRAIGRLKTPIIRDTRGIMSCDDIKISKDGLWVFGDVVATWGAGKNFLDKYEVDSVAAAMVGRCETFAVQVYKMVDRNILVEANLDDENPCIALNPALIEWLREWVPGGYNLLTAALTGDTAEGRVAAIQKIVDSAVGHAFDDSNDFEPASALNSITTIVATNNYTPFTSGAPGWINFNVGNANVDVAETSACDCGNCDPEVVSTYGYRGQVNLVSELGTFTTRVTTVQQFNASHERLRAYLAHNRNTPYDVVAEGITDDIIPGWTELHLSASAQCATVQ